MQNVQLLFSLGPMEMVLIVVAALVLFGPKRLPELGQAMGEGLRSFKDAQKEPRPLPPEEKPPAE